MRQASASLTSVARRLTAERGITRFTVDEDRRRFAERFSARGESSWHRVRDDLIELVIENLELAGVDPAQHTEFMAALERYLSPENSRAFSFLLNQRLAAMRAVLGPPKHLRKANQ